MRRWFCFGVLVGIGVVAALGASHVLRERRLDVHARRTQEELAAGRFEPARARLRILARARPSDTEVAYQLGFCEERLGHEEAARAAWTKIPPGSELGARAAAGIARIDMDAGRYAESELVLSGALAQAPKGPGAAIQRERLIALYRSEGRTREIRPLIERIWAMLPSAGDEPGWNEVSQPLNLLRQYAMLDLEEAASESVRTTLAEAERHAPTDDRVQLALANLAMREGRYDEADRRLHACEAARPTDAPVAQARLDWAMTTGQAKQVRTALDRLPVGWLSPADLRTLSARFAQLRGDASLERRRLEELIGLEPANSAALERLAELAALAGDEPKARALRARKAACDTIKDRYKAEYYRAHSEGRAADLAAWAEALGRRFEARAWWTLLGRLHPGDRTARENLRRLSQLPAQPAIPILAELRAELDRDSSARASEIAVPSNAAVAMSFVDDADRAGLKFVYNNGQTPERQLPETMGGGIALLDFDGDGWLDVYCVQGGPLVRGSGSQAPGDRLFRNRRDGTFVDVTESAGLPATTQGFGNGVAVGDLDNDGDPDLFITRLDSYCLLRNRGDTTFEDATDAVGLGGKRDWPTSAAFADIDNDGDLDLYVCHYAVWDVGHPIVCYRADGSPSYCPPRITAPAADRLFRNDNGHFVDITADARINYQTGRGLGVVAADLNGDGRIDFFVANDGTANFFFRNDGGGRFTDVAEEAGVAANADGGYQAGMGIACGDLDGDGLIDLAVTNFFGESTTFFQNLGHGMFADRTAAAGLVGVTRHLLGFGTAFLDANNDGNLDLLTVNGHVTDHEPEFPFKMPAQLLAGDGRGRLADVSAQAGSVFRINRLGRGLAVGDLDNDGRLDAVAIDQNQPPVYFHNQGRGGHWIRFALEGTDSNRDGVGAVVRIKARGRQWVALRMGGGSYQSASEGRVHFGVGDIARIEQVEVVWPSGHVDRFTDLEADADYRLRERAAAPVRLDLRAR
jgi:hypothetical protein